MPITNSKSMLAGPPRPMDIASGMLDSFFNRVALRKCFILEAFLTERLRFYGSGVSRSRPRVRTFVPYHRLNTIIFLCWLFMRCFIDLARAQTGSLLTCLFSSKYRFLGSSPLAVLSLLTECCELYSQLRTRISWSLR